MNKKEPWNFQFKVGSELMLFYIILGVILAFDNLWFLIISVCGIFGIVILYVYAKRCVNETKQK